MACLWLSSCLESTNLTQAQLVASFTGATSATDLDGNRIQIKWATVPGIQNYMVYQVLDAAMDLSLVANVQGSAGSYIDSTLSVYQTKSYIVRAVESDGTQDGNTNVVSATTFGGVAAASFTNANTLSISISNPSGLSAAASALNIYGLFAGSSSYQLLQSSPPSSSFSGVTVPGGQALQKVLVRMVSLKTGIEDGNTVLVTPVAPAVSVQTPAAVPPAQYPKQVLGQSSGARTVSVSGTCTYGAPISASSLLGAAIGTFTCAFGGTFTGSVTYPVSTSGPDTLTVSQLFGGGVSVGTSVTIDLVSCPAGYAMVPGDSTQGTTAFCFPKYPLKNSSSTGLAVSAPAWDSGTSAPTNTYGGAHVTFQQAVDECTALGSNYHLTTNSEWMTVARNAEQNATNWMSDTPSLNHLVGVGLLANSVPQGATTGGGCYPPAYDTPQSPAGDPAAGPSDPANWYHMDSVDYNAAAAGGAFAGTGIAGATQWSALRRTLYLSNGEVLWDLSNISSSSAGTGGTHWIDLNGQQSLFYFNSSTDASLMSLFYGGNGCVPAIGTNTSSNSTSLLSGLSAATPSVLSAAVSPVYSSSYFVFFATPTTGSSCGSGLSNYETLMLQGSHWSRGATIPQSLTDACFLGDNNITGIYSISTGADSNQRYFRCTYQP